MVYYVTNRLIIGIISKRKKDLMLWLITGLLWLIRGKKTGMLWLLSLYLEDKTFLLLINDNWVCKLIDNLLLVINLTIYCNIISRPTVQEFEFGRV